MQYPWRVPSSHFCRQLYRDMQEDLVSQNFQHKLILLFPHAHGSQTEIPQNFFMQSLQGVHKINV
jgi:hypothetical protein